MYIRFQKPIIYWNYYLAIEDDLLATSKYVDFDIDNRNTFSTEFSKIFLEACSEIDVLLFEICKLYGLRKEKANFADYFKYITKHQTTIISEGLQIDKYSISIFPYREWSKDNELNWHQQYNQIKHHRGKYYKNGNLDNAITAVSALYTTVIHYYLSDTQARNTKTNIAISDIVNSLTPINKLIQYENEINRYTRL